MFPEIASTCVKPYFEKRRRSINQRLASDLFKYEIQWGLANVGISAWTEEDPQYEQSQSELTMNPLANNGIEGIVNGWGFKILRSRDGSVPSAGRAGRRRSYCAQQLRLIPLDNSGSSQDRPNSILLWDFDEGYENVSLKLAVPSEVIGRIGLVKCYFNVEVPDPITRMQETPTESPDNKLIDPPVRRKIEEQAPEPKVEDKIEGDDETREV